MSFSLGIIGQPKSGKTTLFKALTSLQSETVSDREAHLSRIPVPDKRLQKLSKIFKPEKTTPVYIDFIDIGGLAQTSAGRKGINTQILNQIRQTDALIEVVRCFESSFYEKITPLEDIKNMQQELILADLESVENKLKKEKKPNEKEKALFGKLKDLLLQEKIISKDQLDEEEKVILKNISLLTLKPKLLILNISEKQINKTDSATDEVLRQAESHNILSLSVCAKLEEELSQLDPETALQFRKESGIKQKSLDQLIQTSFQLLNLITFYTVVGKETRAWTIEKGSKIIEAAGKIHTDMQRGFIKAEVINYKDFVECGSFQKAKEKGLLRLEGKDYIVLDGDICQIRFNV